MSGKNFDDFVKDAIKSKILSFRGFISWQDHQMRFCIREIGGKD